MGAILRGEHALVDGTNQADRDRLIAAGYVDDGPVSLADIQALVQSGTTFQDAQQRLLSMPLFFAPPASASEGRPIFRIANRTTGRRFQTTDEFEKNQLVQTGVWTDEGIAYRGGVFPTTPGTRLRRVFQLLHPNGGGIFLTVHDSERATALAADFLDADSGVDPESFERGGGYIDVQDGDGRPIPLGDEVSLDPLPGLVPIHRMFKRVPTFRLHIRVTFLASGGNLQPKFDTQIQRVRELFARLGMSFEVASDERGSISTPLAGVAVGECEAFDGGLLILDQPTADQAELFSHRLGVPLGEMVAYFVRNTIPPLGGCAASPIDKPSLIVTGGSDEFTLAHEIGHVLGLKHAPADQPNRLMHPGGAPGGSVLTDQEIATIKQSFRLI